ncbi:VRR-NUC domain-containing protein [Chitinophaga sp. sic0106]|uniref:VRR-NUC domain-containing protein n=1 Tax=Chitinophaga sp. sic0106 TaxID=2854785 RepID=UPI001C46B432|nr:VRR-NUC domain-containing protein [Chitinophaga sp. sic0106]MBV7534070.1 VRR-NUC domain-containing protein [Chitinophaga sp. sic0106]
MKESQLQARCYQWAHNTYPQLRGLLFAVPNGGTRNVREAMALKATGVVPGIPDMVCLYGGRPVGFELKADAGRTSKEQEKIHQVWQAAGIEVYLVRDEETFQSLIKSIVQ